MIALLTSSRYGLCEYEMQQMCRLHLNKVDCGGWSSSWPALAHLVAPFLQRVVVGGLGLLSWRDATFRQQMINTFLAEKEEARSIHRKMFNYFWTVWKEARSSLQNHDWIELAAPSSALTNLRYNSNE